MAIIFSFAVTLSAQDEQSLPKIKPAPEFTLTNQDGKRLALKELRGKVLAITFIFASCADTCPLLTAKMAGMQNALATTSARRSISSRSPWTRSATRRRSSSAMPKAQGEYRRLGVSHRHIRRDPRGRQTLRHLLQENAARRRGSYISDFARGSKRHAPRPVHGSQV